MHSQLVYVIHKQDYKENGALLSLLGQETGRFQAIIHGVKGGKRNSKAALIQPFQQLQIFSKHTPYANTLVSIRQIETTSIRFPLSGNASLCGFYLNELLYRLVHEQIDAPVLFERYQQSCYQLLKSMNEVLEQQARMQSWALRKFEFELLEQIGHGINPEHDVHGEALLSSALYHCIADYGIVPAQHQSDLNLSGRCLSALLGETMPEGCLGGLKRMLQQLIQAQLGTKPLQSVRLWQQMSRIESK